MTGIAASIPAQGQSVPPSVAEAKVGEGSPQTQGDPQSTNEARVAEQQADFDEINALTWKGWITPVPGYDDTLLGDTGGWRSALANAGIGASVWSLHNLSYDVANAGRRYPGQQLYNGQKFNAITSSQTAFITYDLGRIGLDGGQLNVGAIATLNGNQARNGPRHLNVRHLYWYQPVAAGRAELELGWITNQLDFVGIYVGGSLAGGTLGPQASIPVQAGMSFGSFSAPTASAKINWSKSVYTRTAIQRSLSPQGPSAERENNSSGLEWAVPGAKPLLIQEVGFRTKAGAGKLSNWYRAGIMHNLSRYRVFSSDRTRNNDVFYILGDQQVTQPDGQTPARGIYLGASYNQATSSVNLIDRYFEGRVYVKGPFPSRGSDMASIVYGLNSYSRAGRNSAQSDLDKPHASTSAITASYSYRVMNGLYLQPGVSVTFNPVFNRQVDTAVNALFGINLFF